MIRRLFPLLALVFLMTGRVPAAAHGDAENTDAALNASYQSLLSKLDSAGQQGLREAQRAWLSFRDKECVFLARGGAVQTARSACVNELTQWRTEALDREIGRLAGVTGTISGAGPDIPCSRSVDKAIADTLVRQCMQVSPATHPPCNADNTCNLIRDEIKRGCAMIDKEDAPAFCAGFRQ